MLMSDTQLTLEEQEFLKQYMSRKYHYFRDIIRYGQVLAKLR